METENTKLLNETIMQFQNHITVIKVVDVAVVGSSLWKGPFPTLEHFYLII